MRKVSRSALEAFSSCPRKGYHLYLDHGGSGVEVPPDKALCIGLAVHKGMEMLLRGSESPSAEAALIVEFKEQMGQTTFTAEWNESLLLARALFLGWVRAKWHDFQTQFEIIQVEEEREVLLAPNIPLQLRRDALVRDRHTGHLLVVNWKTTSDSGRDWTASWEDEVQMWTECLSEESLGGEDIVGVLVEGFCKRTSSAGYSTSPLIRCNFNTETSEYSWESERAKIWRRLNIERDYPGGLQAWVNALPIEVVEAQYFRSAPILKNDDVVRDWLRQQVRYITDVQRMMEPDVSEEDRLAFFGQNFGKYRCRWCPFKPACKKRNTIAELLQLGRLRPRRDHHAVQA